MGYGTLQVLFYPDLYQKLYNCSSYNVDDIPLSSRQHPMLGSIYIILFFVYETSHLLTLPVMYQRMKQLSCYKIMFYLSLFDFSALPVIALGSGVFMFMGFVFCSNPTFFYALGIGASPWWYCETMAAILLAFNRCVDVIDPRWADRLFHGWKTWLWLLLPTLYGIHHLIFAPTIIFSGVIGCWHFNPHVGYLEDTDGSYSAVELARHNAAVLTLLTTLYTTFCLKLIWSMRSNVSDAEWKKRVREKKGLFVQVFLISLGHLGTAFFYTFMHYVQANAYLATIAQLMWISAHGMPGVVYLTMNSSIRADVLKNLGVGDKRNRIGPTTTGPLTGMDLATTVKDRQG
ncbi:SRT-25 protein [Aphelenchoides avenae]|nr:SRT-25 protein [Aphelenchus avenae]